LLLGMHKLSVRAGISEVGWWLLLCLHGFRRLLLVSPLSILVTVSGYRRLLAVVCLLVELLAVEVVLVLFELNSDFGGRTLPLLVCIVHLLPISVRSHLSSLPPKCPSRRVTLLIFWREIVSRRTLSLGWGRPLHG